MLHSNIMSSYYIILLMPLCHSINSNISLFNTLSCNSYVSDVISSSNEIKYYLFNNSMHEYPNNKSFSVLFDLCKSSNSSTFDTIIYIYDIEWNLLHFNDTNYLCEHQQSQLVLYPTDNQYIIGIGSNSEIGVFHLNISCNNNLMRDHPTTFATTPQPTLPDEYIKEPYCDGLIFENNSIPAGVCMISTDYPYMYDCINGKIHKQTYFGNDCTGRSKILLDFCDSLFGAQGKHCEEFCNIGPCEYYLVTSYHDAAYCDGNVPKGQEMYHIANAYILDYCRDGTKHINNGTHILVTRYSTPTCDGQPYESTTQYNIGSSCNYDPVQGVSSEVIYVGIAPGTKSPTNLPTLSPTFQPSISPTLSTISPTSNPSMVTESPTTSEPTSETISPTVSPSDNPTIPSLPPTTYHPTMPTIEPTANPTRDIIINDMHCDGIAIKNAIGAQPAGVCLGQPDGSQMFECVDGRIAYTFWESSDCSGVGYSYNPYCDFIGKSGDDNCKEFCGLGPCDYFKETYLHHVSYCDGNNAKGSGITYSSLTALVLDWCRNVGQNESYKYIVNDGNIQNVMYITSDCTGDAINIDNESQIGPECDTDPYTGIINAKIISIGTASGTHLPSSSPTMPSVSPTYDPSSSPTVPTLSPTHTKAELCEDNKWCYYVDLYPIFGNEVSETVGMANEIEEEDSELHVQFTSKYRDCVAPVISVSFEEIDFSSKYEYFEVIDNDNNTITKCRGTQDANCGHWIQCLDNYPLGMIKIVAESTYNITIRTTELNARCNSNNNSYSANIGLSMTCSSETATPTIEPTLQPTFDEIAELFGTSVHDIYCDDSFEGELELYLGQSLFLYRLIDNVTIGTKVFVDTCYPETDIDINLNMLILPYYNLTNIVNGFPDGYLNVTGYGCVQGEYVYQMANSEILIAIYPLKPGKNNGESYGSSGPFKMTVFCGTDSPTGSPTAAPTRYPTEIDAYDTYIDVTYVISSVSLLYIDYMAGDFMNIMSDITAIIEQGYADHKVWSSTLEFQYFWLQILTMNNEELTKLANDEGLSLLLQYFNQKEGFILKSRIECSEFICDRIRYGYEQRQFEVTVAKLLDTYFRENTLTTDAENSGSSELSFSVLSMSELYTLDSAVDDGIQLFVWILCIILLLSLLIICGCCYKQFRITKEINAKTIYIKNPMVIPIAIGSYDLMPTKPEISGKLKDLNGVHVDVDSVIGLFGDKGLNYDISPNYQQYELGSYKISWTEKELVDFLQKKSDHLEQNLKYEQDKDQYDGLVVIFTGHGTDRYIITSDYKLVSKVAIHRIFSAKQPKNRKIPRIFLFDCCSGSRDKERVRSRHSIAKDQGKGISLDDNDEKYSDTMDVGKNIQMNDIARKESIIWANDEDNPDFRLVTIEAANEGFQSKMSLIKGSYVITQFVQRLEDNICNNKNRKFLNEILDEIQEKLHDDGKQLMVKTMNNKTEFIKFIKNGTDKSDKFNDGDGNIEIGGRVVLAPESPTTNKSAKQQDKDAGNNRIALPGMNDMIALNSASLGNENEGDGFKNRMHDFDQFDDGVMMEMTTINTKQ